MYIYIISGSPHGLADQALQDGAYVDARDVGPGLVWSHGKTTGSPLKALKDVEKAMGFRVKMAGRRQESPGTC